METNEEKTNQRKRQSKLNKRLAVDVGRFIAVNLAQGVLAAAGARLVQIAIQRKPQAGEVIQMNRKAM